MCTLWHKTETLYRLATSEKPGETGKTFHSVCRELLVGLLLGVAKDGREHSLCGKSWITAVNCLRWSVQNGTDRNSFNNNNNNIYIYQTALGNVNDWNMHKGCVAFLWRSGTAGRIFQTFDEQFVAVDDVRPTVSAGQTVFWTHPPPPPPSIRILLQKEKKGKKWGILNALPHPNPTSIFLYAWTWPLCDQTKKRTVS